MRKLFVLLPITLVLLGAVSAPGYAPESVRDTAAVTDVLVTDVVGAARYFWCMTGQAMMWGGLFTLQPEITLVGSIVMGVSCGLGI